MFHELSLKSEFSLVSFTDRAFIVSYSTGSASFGVFLCVSTHCLETNQETQDTFNGYSSYIQNNGRIIKVCDLPTSPFSEASLTYTDLNDSGLDLTRWSVLVFLS